MKQYDREKYWSAEGDSIASRTPGRRLDVAGQDSPFFRYKRDALLHLLEGLLWRDRTVVEVGCGPGGNISVLAALGAKQVTGVDVSKTMAQEAWLHLGGLAPRVGVLVADGAHLPLQSRIADVGLTVTVLQHLDTATAASVVSELGRVCENEIVLCEDISVVGVGIRSTHVMRRQGDYVSMARSSGFRLVATIPLKVFASEVVTTLVRGLVDGLRQPDFEGPSPMRATVERTLMPLTRFIDPYTPQLGGLTCMQFIRNTTGAM